MAKLLDIHIKKNYCDKSVNMTEYYCYRGEWLWVEDLFTGQFSWAFVRESIVYSGELISNIKVPMTYAEQCEAVKIALKADNSLIDADFRGEPPV